MARIETDSRFVIFVGNNAQGKTNVLEAAYALANLRPINTTKSGDLVAFGASKMTLAGGVRLNGVVRSHKVIIEPPKKRIVMVDQKKVVRLVDYFRGFRAIAFTPQNLEIVAGSPGIRRSWLDRATFTANPGHLDVVRKYGLLIQQKNALLKEYRVDDLLLESLNQQLSVAGAQLINSRVTTLENLNRHIPKIYTTISHETETINVEYQCDFIDQKPSEMMDALREKFRESKRAELSSRRTLIGPHRDDVTLLVNARSLRQFGSRGQIRTAVLACKLAELKTSSLMGVTPPFLYDDVGSELDSTRMESLVAVLEELDTQVFFTTTSLDHLACLPKNKGLIYRVNNGEFSG